LASPLRLLLLVLALLSGGCLLRGVHLLVLQVQLLLLLFLLLLLELLLLRHERLSGAAVLVGGHVLGRDLQRRRRSAEHGFVGAFSPLRTRAKVSVCVLCFEVS
jgi:hypothetical protein